MTSPKQADEAFELFFKEGGYQYGREEKRDAFGWFQDGWNQRARLSPSVPEGLTVKEECGFEPVIHLHAPDGTLLAEADAGSRKAEWLKLLAYPKNKMLSAQPPSAPPEAGKAITLAEHTKHVSDFLNELYATMIDPCAEGTMTVKETCDALLKAAVEQRELLHALRHPAPPTGSDGWKERALAAESKLNSPELHDFREAIVIEAAHQRERWGSEHDDGKSAEDWLWLVAYLATKATQANRYGDNDKYLHHIITCAAACANWHAFATGANTEMRPGVDPIKYEAAPPKPAQEER